MTTSIQSDISTGSQRPRSADIHPGPGFRIRPDVPRTDSTVIQGLSEFPTPEISDLLNRLYAIDSEIRCLNGAQRPLCGSACTVRVYPGDNLMVHKALDIARPGDVIVIAASGTRSNAVLGDIISTKALHRGVAGFIVDGLIRDLPSIKPLELPVYARGTTPIGPLHRGPGEINFPVACGGVVVNPGDVIVADDAGIVVVPQQAAIDLLQRLQAHAHGNAAYLAAVRHGNFNNTWVDAQLEQQGCLIV
ncbi:RraA family protein [Pseudonocardia bannensis]|uniref:Putative 4-hydroxy-4-methyl-2-oxoglutarate aldolase n=1 Tax=Pseudonocardia bannensis TaxID=630973 RepID=A0A848DEU6_9PSEU|nr:RraA family protein [Pseudonocardia bannensis]NMH91142.1 RraA family protein [Pseudonocardia bannensis]